MDEAAGARIYSREMKPKSIIEPENIIFNFSNSIAKKKDISTIKDLIPKVGIAIEPEQLKEVATEVTAETLEQAELMALK